MNQKNYTKFTAQLMISASVMATGAMATEAGNSNPPMQQSNINTSSNPTASAPPTPIEKLKKRKSKNAANNPAPAVNAAPADANVQPQADANVQQPQADANVQQPQADANVQQPQVDANVQQPQADANVQQPQVDANVQQPQADANVQQPQADANVQQPQADVNAAPAANVDFSDDDDADMKAAKLASLSVNDAPAAVPSDDEAIKTAQFASLKDDFEKTTKVNVTDIKNPVFQNLMNSMEKAIDEQSLDINELTAQNDAIQEAQWAIFQEKDPLKKEILEAEFIGAAAPVMISTASPLIANTIAMSGSAQVASALGMAPSAINVNGFSATNAFAKQDNLAKLSQSGLSAGQGANATTLDNGVFIKTFGGWENRDKHAKAEGSKTATFGVSLGMLHTIYKNMVVGASVQYARVNSKVNHGLAKSDGNSYSASLLAGYTNDNLLIDGSVTFGVTRFNAKRHVSAALLGTGADETGLSKPKSVDVSASLGASYAIDYNNVTVTPFANLTYLHSVTNAFTETGISKAANQIASDKFKLGLLTPKAGVSFTKATKLYNGVQLTPTLNVGYKGLIPMGDKEMLGKIGHLNAIIGEKGFIKTYHTATFGVSTGVQINNSLKADLGYEGAFGKGIQSHDVMVRLTKKF